MTLILRDVEDFEPQIKYDKENDVLKVVLRDRSTSEIYASTSFEVLENNNKTGDHDVVAGFKLWGAKEMLRALDYQDPTIGLFELLLLFKEYNQTHPGVEVFGKYEKQLFAVVNNCPQVWEIPK